MALALSFDEQLKALAAVVCASFAFLLLLARTRERPPHLLAVFLLLIAANQAAEVLRGTLEGDAAERAYLAATVFAALDPAALVWFIAALAPSRRMDRYALPLTLVVAGVLALTAGFRGVSDPLSLTLKIYTGLVYIFLAARAAAPAMAEPRPGAATLLFAALIIVALPVFPGSSEQLTGKFLRGQEYFIWTYVTDVLLLLGGILLILLASTRGGAFVPRRMALIVGAGVGVWFVLNTFHLVRAIGGNEMADPFLVVGRSGAPFRWLTFATLMSMVIVRQDALALTQQERRRAARAFLALFILTVGAFFRTLLQVTTGFEVRPLEFLLVTAIVLVSQGFRQVLDDLAWHLYAVPKRGDVAARHETYRAAAAQSALRGSTPARDVELQRLRRDLEIDPATASALERLADANLEVSLSAGQLVGGRYRIERLVGRGGAGRAFLARDELLHRYVVVKEVLHAPDVDESVIMREARLAASVREEHVVTVHDVLARAGALLIVTEHVEGGSLDDLIARGPPSPEQAERILEGILVGLRAVHERGIVHGDLKPANILLTSNRAPKIGDFGIARLTHGATAEFGRSSGVLQGTLGFLAPEVRSGAAPTTAADVYAVGLIARAMASEITPGWLAPIIERALAEDVDARWPDASAFLDALRRARVGQLQ